MKLLHVPVVIAAIVKSIATKRTCASSVICASTMVAAIGGIALGVLTPSMRGNLVSIAKLAIAAVSVCNVVAAIALILNLCVTIAKAAIIADNVMV